MNYIVFAGEQYYPGGGGNDIYAFTNTLEDAITYYYEAQVSGLHNCDLQSKTWSNQEKYKGQGNCWAHIYCLKTKQKIKEQDYINKREEYDTLHDLRYMYNKDEYNKEIQKFTSLSKTKYIIEYSELKYEIMYNLFIHKYLEKGLTKKQIKNKIWWFNKKTN